VPNPIFYVIPETHTNQQDQERSKTLAELALELTQARGTARAELTMLQQKGAVTKQATSQELAQYISNFLQAPPK
jgi:hypothetical protein